MKEFSIPIGGRDLTGKECEAKRLLQRRLEDFMRLWGYEEVMTPSVEFYKTFQTGFESLREEEMFKFFNTQGRIVTLRMDMTIPIARLVSTRFQGIKEPLRLMYSANVFQVEKEMALRQHEVTDCGMELIGKGGREGDLEILTCASELLMLLKLPDFTLELGNIALFHSACKNLRMSPKETETLSRLIDKKSLKELGNYAEKLPIFQEAKDFFAQLPLLCGGREVIQEARERSFNKEMLQVLGSMEELMDDLEDLGYGDFISLDFGKIPRLNYYTGLIFEAFIKGAGLSVLSGGRYDALLKKFGPSRPAVGFSVKIDELIHRIPSQTAEETQIITYAPGQIRQALEEARNFQRRGKRVLLQQGGQLC